MSTKSSMTADLEAIRERAADATPGPWEVTSDGGMIITNHPYPSGQLPPESLVIIEDATELDDPDGPRTEDMQFIANAPTDIAALLAMVDHLKDKHAEVQALSMRRGEEIARLRGELNAKN